MISVPLLTPYLSSLWLGLVTPVYARVGRKLVEGLRNPDRGPGSVGVGLRFPSSPRSLAEAIQRALVNEDREFAETRWSDALSSAGPLRAGAACGSARGSSIRGRPRSRCRPRWPLRPSSGSAARPAGTTATGCGSCVAGSTCWSAASACAGDDATRWTCRSAMPVDFWRVEAIEPGRRLRLAAEMKLPGRAWLEFEVTRNGPGFRGPSDGNLRSRGPAGAGVLVRALPGASTRVCGHASGNRAGGAA